MKIEITAKPNLSDREATLCAMHSFYNVINVISLELQFLAKAFGQPNALERSRQLCLVLRDSFADREAALRHLRDLEVFRQTIEAEVTEARRAAGSLQPGREKPAAEAEENLRGILQVAEVRVGEILARQQAPGRWQRYAPGAISESLRQVFLAIARNSHGRYRIAFSESEHGADSYLIEFAFAPDATGQFLLPPEAIDSLRDLCANARKYTPIGGRLRAGLSDDGAAVTVSVSDSGRGIPADELDQVVKFGYRARNVEPQETRGGGFGLTKAWLMTCRHGGRMCLESELGSGTTVTLRLPRPPEPK